MSPPLSPFAGPARAGAASLALRCAIGAAGIALVRTALFLARCPGPGGDLDGPLVAAAARLGAKSFTVALVGAVVAGSLAAVARRRLPRLTLFAAAAVAAFAFASFRLPLEGVFLPGLDSTTTRAANAACAAAALAAAALAVRGPLRGERLLGGAALALAAAAVATALLAGGPAARWPERPNLLLVSLDTLRADRLGCYGYERDTTPELDRFAAEALRFERAYSPQAWTLTAHMTMLTSLQPYVHGVDHGKSLAPEARTLAGELSLRGYTTLAVVDDCMWLAERWGFARGFDLYYRVGKPADFKVDEVLALVDHFPRGPLFLFAHFFDAHSDVDRLPYDSDPRDAEAFAAWYEGEFDGCDAEGRCASRFLTAANNHGYEPSEEDRRFIESLYDAGVRTLDRQLGRLFRGLEARGWLDAAAVLVTADHGEEFWEHGRVLHGQGYDECLRVPFLLRTPDTAGGVSSRGVSHVDVMPTLLDLAGVEPRGLQGRSLAPLLRGEELAELPVVTSSAERLTGLRLGARALVARGALGGGFAVFDVENDPGQTVPLDDGGELERTLRALEEEMADLRALLAPREGGGRLSAEEREALEDLGYLGE